jgi:hypothetical protein
MPLRFNVYEISEEAGVMKRNESVPLQSAMGSEQGAVLVQRMVLKLSRLRANRKRSLRLANRNAALRLLLYPESSGSIGMPSRESYPLNRSKVWSRTEGESDDEGLSEDEPLARRVRASVVELSVVEESDDESSQSEEEQSEEEGEQSEEEVVDVDEVDHEEVSDVGSNFGEQSGYEEEYELSSEEESDEESDCEGAVIFQGRSMIPLRQSLVSRFFM